MIFKTMCILPMTEFEALWIRIVNISMHNGKVPKFPVYHKCFKSAEAVRHRLHVTSELDISKVLLSREYIPWFQITIAVMLLSGFVQTCCKLRCLRSTELPPGQSISGISFNGQFSKDCNALKARGARSQWKLIEGIWGVIDLVNSNALQRSQHYMAVGLEGLLLYFFSYESSWSVGLTVDEGNT